MNKPTRIFPKINFKNTSSEEIENIIRSLRSKESCGYEEISTKILKISAPFISSPLTHIFNRAMFTGIFPARMKYALVKPLFKKGEKKGCKLQTNLLTVVFLKVLEKLIYSRIMKHVVDNNILTLEQYGFRPSSSTELALFNFINHILEELQKKKNIVGGIFLDLQKAFDCANHEILLNKLISYGITGTTFKLIKTYLQNRYQRVVLNNNFFTSGSEWGKIINGVSQGSTLGPLLFLLYINDLPSSTNNGNKIVLFADDTSIITSKPCILNFRNDINKVLHHIQKWFNTNLIFLNWE